MPLISGGYDYLLKFVTVDVIEYQTTMERLLDLEIGIGNISASLC